MHRFIYLLLGLTIAVLSPNPVEARGGRGDQFRGGNRREARPAQVQRTPSMSRSFPEQRFDRDNINRSYENRAVAKPVTADQATRNLERNRYPQKTNLESIKNREAARFQNKQSLGDDVRRNIYRNNHQPHQWFNEQFWRNNPNPWYRRAANTNWWQWATWASITSWLAWDLASPVYYDYADNGNVYYSDGNVYVDGEEAYSADQYAQQAESLITNIPPVDPDQVSWLPLGVFALTSNEKSSSTPNMYIQLALSKEGVISGTYINDMTQIVKPIEGQVDKLSQVAVWRVASPDSRTPVMETGLENLTEGETSVLVHFPDGTTQTWLMVRLQEPVAQQPSE